MTSPGRISSPTLGHLAQHPLHVSRNGAGLQGGGLGRFREPLSVDAHDAGSKILRFADDRRVRHAHELVAHLGRDVLERALDDADGNRVHPAVGAPPGAAGVAVAAAAAVGSVADAGAGLVATTTAAQAAADPLAAGATGAEAPRRALAHGDSSMLMMRLPASSAWAVLPGGMTVVESRCSTTAGPENGSPTGRRSRR